MNTVLWTMAIVLAVAFTIGGLTQILCPKERYRELAASQHWADDFTAQQVKAIGTIKTIGALGLVLPAAVVPVLVPLAASGLMLFMAGAGTTRRASAAASPVRWWATCSSSRPSPSSRGGASPSSPLAGERLGTVCHLLHPDGASGGLGARVATVGRGRKGAPRATSHVMAGRSCSRGGVVRLRVRWRRGW